MVTMNEGHENLEYTEEELVNLDRGKIFFHTVKDCPDLMFIESPNPLVPLYTFHFYGDYLVLRLANNC